jgi:hypothetical protein
MAKAILTDEGIRLGLKIPIPCSGPGGAPLRKVIELFRFVPLKVKLPFSCSVNAAITEQDTPHLYMLMRHTLADAGFSTSLASRLQVLAAAGSAWGRFAHSIALQT